MDNQVTKHIKKFLIANDCKLQVVAPHNHQVNAAKRAIQTFKAAFIAALATMDSDFPLQLWDRLTPQVEDTLNMLHASCVDQMKLAYEILLGRRQSDAGYLQIKLVPRTGEPGRLPKQTPHGFTPHCSAPMVFTYA